MLHSKAALISTLSHSVFVYGTLKRGFYNYDSILLPGNKKFQRLLLEKDTTTITDTDISSSSSPSLISTKTTPLCQQVTNRASINGSILFVDAYFIPYLILSDNNNEILNNSDHRKGLNNPQTVVEGEVYQVNDAMLKRLDELEGVAKGRYKRSLVDVCIMGLEKEEQQPTKNIDTNPQGESLSSSYTTKLPAWVYHLSSIPPPVMTIMKSKLKTALTNDQIKDDIINTVDNPQTLQGDECIQIISSYRLNEHKKYYIPPKQRQEPERYYQSWGGYIFPSPLNEK